MEGLKDFFRVSLSLCSSLYLSVPLSLYLSISLFVSLSLYLSVPPSLYLSVFLSPCLCGSVAKPNFDRYEKMDKNP